MNGQGSAQQSYHRGMHVGSFGYNNGNNDLGGVPFEPQLPPIRRINNHLPPRLPTPVGVKSSNAPMVAVQNKIHSRQTDAESVMNFSQSESESEYDGSFSDDDDEYSVDHTTYTYAEDEPPTTNFNCMNSLFLPTANEKEGSDDAALIRCHRVGPSSAELQLNIPLPSRYMNHLATVKEGERSGYMDNVCRAPGLNYNSSHYDPALVDESVVEVDPYKQFRERIAPQFYESLIEELSDEDADSDEDEDPSFRQRDDSQIFGSFDAHRTAMLQAIYNEVVLQQGYMVPPVIQSLPSQIFVTESSSTSPTLMTPDGEAQESLNLVDFSLGGSSDVFSRPDDSQDSLLNKHLRESVEIVNTAVYQPHAQGNAPVTLEDDLVFSGNHSVSVSVSQRNRIVASGPSRDESSKQSIKTTLIARDESQSRVIDIDSQSQISSDSSTGVDKYAVLEQTKEDMIEDEILDERNLEDDLQPLSSVGLEYASEKESHDVEQDVLAEVSVEICPLVGKSSFDEPGQITMKPQLEEELMLIPRKKQVSVDPVSRQNGSEDEAKDEEIYPIYCAPNGVNDDAPEDEVTRNRDTSIEDAATQVHDDVPEDENTRVHDDTPADEMTREHDDAPEDETTTIDKDVVGEQTAHSHDDAPDDEMIRVPFRMEGVGPSLTFLESLLENDNDALAADENDEFATHQLDMSPSDVFKPYTIDQSESSDVSTWSQDDTVVMKNEEVKTVDGVKNDTGFSSIHRNVITEAFEENLESNGKSPKAFDEGCVMTAMVRRFRPILEETSKANVRTEIYETTATSEVSEKTSRELRKDRIRNFDQVWPTPEATKSEDGLTMEDAPDAYSYYGDVTVDEQRDDVDEVTHDLDDLMEFHSCDEDFFTSHTDSELFSDGFA